MRTDRDSVNPSGPNGGLDDRRRDISKLQLEVRRPVNSNPPWKKLIWVVMFLVVLEGAARKWIFPGFQAQIFFVKDLILLVAYGGFLASSPHSGAHLRVIGGLKIIFALS